MNVQIIPIHNDYAAAVVDIILPIQQKEFNVPITLEDQPDLLDIDRCYYQDGGCFWGAMLDGELVGTIALLKYGANEGAVRKMFVKKDYRGKELGVAGKLLEALISYSKANDLAHLYLGTVSILGAARRFYEKNGFVEVEKSSLPAAFPLMSADNIFCHLNLKTAV